jgi:hypothetical protein
MTRACASRGQWHGIARGLGLVFRPCKAEVQKRVAEVAKALCQRIDDQAVLLARAITPPSVGAGALPQIACTPRSVDMYSAGGCLQ